MAGGRGANWNKTLPNAATSQYRLSGRKVCIILPYEVFEAVDNYRWDNRCPNFSVAAVAILEAGVEALSE